MPTKTTIGMETRVFWIVASASIASPASPRILMLSSLVRRMRSPARTTVIGSAMMTPTLSFVGTEEVVKPGPPRFARTSPHGLRRLGYGMADAPGPLRPYGLFMTYVSSSTQPHLSEIGANPDC